MTKIDIEVAAKVDEAVAGLGKVDKSLEGMGGSTKAAGLSLTDLKSGLDLASQAFAAVQGAVKSVIDPVVDYAKQVRDLSAFTGVSAEESSTLIQVFDDLQIEYGTLKTASRKLTDDGLTPNIETLADLSDQYLDLPDDISRAQFATENFGAKAGPEMSRLLALGSDAILKMGDDAARTGLVMDEQGVKSAQNYEKAIDDWEDSVMAGKIALSESLLPALTATVDAGTDYLNFWHQSVAAVLEGRESYLDVSKAAWEVVFTDKTLTEATDDLTGSYQAQQAAINEVDPAIQNLRLAQADLAVSTTDSGASADASAARWQGLADAYYDAQIAAENTQAIGQSLAAGLSGTIGQAQEAYKQVIAETQPEIDGLNEKLAHYQELQGQTVTVVDEAQHSAAEYELAQIKAATAVQTLAEYTGDNREEQLQLQVAADNATSSVAKMGEEMGITKEFTLDYTKQMQDGNLTLAELNAKQAEAEAQLKKTTSQFLFQQVASSLTKEAQLELANSLGLIDDASYDAAIAMQDLTGKYDTNHDGTIDAKEATADYKREVLELRDSINSMSDKVVNVDVRHTTTYQDKYLDDYRAATGSGRAVGGPVSAGSPYVVGENGPEMFFPGQSGGVLNNGDFRSMVSALQSIAAGGGRGGNVYNITANPQPGWSLADDVRLLQMMSPSA